MNSYFKKGLVHPFLLIFYYIIYGINAFHPVGNEWQELFMLLFGLILGIIPLLIVSYFLFKNKINGRIWLTISLFFILFFVPIHLTLNYVAPSVFKREWHSFLFLGVSLIPLSLFVFFKKKTWENTNQYLNILLMVFSLYELSQYSLSIFQDRNNEKIVETHGQGKKYNIYLIIPDGYASTQNFKKYWDFDNSEFVNYFKNKGFFIANNSRSNYWLTVLSVSSMLDLNYKKGAENAQWTNVRNIENNMMYRTLENCGYDCHLDIFNGKELISGRQNNLLSLYRTYFMQTAGFKLAVWFFDYDLMNCKPINKQIPCQHLENELKKDQKAPQFVYMHPMFTHIPFTDTLKSLDDNFGVMVDENKKIAFQNDSFKVTTALKSLGVKENDHFFGQYLFQIKRTNVWLYSTLDKFWSKIEKNSIVIVMSDHGSRFIPGNSEEANLEKFQNFCAVYFPDQDYSKLTDTITPINVMRMTLNKAVGTHLDYLPDKINMR